MADIDPFASTTGLLTALRAGRVTSRDLTELYIVAGLETACGVPEWKGYDR